MTAFENGRYHVRCVAIIWPCCYHHEGHGADGLFAEHTRRDTGTRGSEYQDRAGQIALTSLRFNTISIYHYRVGVVPSGGLTELGLYIYRLLYRLFHFPGPPSHNCNVPLDRLVDGFGSISSGSV